VILWLTDILDGYFARKRNEISELGKIIDPLADKISVITITFLLLLKGILPLWFFIVILSRDLIILLGGLYIKKKYEVILQSNWIGKLTVFIIGFTLLNMILISGLTSSAQNNIFSYHIEKLELYWNVLILINIVMIVFSLVSYFKKFLNIISINK
jgi:CDP-diacylglycerol--glycerol-3-phosphate 3-phosphatidyltransferase